jgi:uncharacterized protein (DUF433 family)
MSTAAEPLNDIGISREHIVATPGVCGGKPRIGGHRIKVAHVVIWHERMGLSADEIVVQHPELKLADVYAALTYYWDHQGEIDADIQASTAFADSLRGNEPSILDKIKQRHAANHPLPPG